MFHSAWVSTLKTFSQTGRKTFSRSQSLWFVYRLSIATTSFWSRRSEMPTFQRPRSWWSMSTSKTDPILTEHRETRSLMKKMRFLFSSLWLQRWFWVWIHRQWAFGAQHLQGEIPVPLQVNTAAGIQQKSQPLFRNSDFYKIYWCF